MAFDLQIDQLTSSHSTLSIRHSNSLFVLAGTPRASDHILFVLSRFARVVLLFAVVVLVGTRWTFLHPINRKGKTVLFFLIIPLQILAHVAFAVIDKTEPYIQNWVTWNQVFFLLDFISCCAVVVLFASAMLLLRRITSKAQKSEPAMNLDRFSLIRRFYLLVFGYMFFTQFVMLALKELIAYDYQWVSNLIEETVTLMFCFVVLYVFRLLEKDEYSVIGDVEE
ncbi:hypothetical protein Fmac_027700 [Flemingia macrophylla]|uniref:Transmembrane protein n=1 Tax=Flemingia macrophylla TaxID=520843 RepID=A0ABD1LIG5_9FABA